MLEKCDWTKYLINILKHNYQSNNTCAVTFDFCFSLCNHNIYILIVARLFKRNKSPGYEEIGFNVVKKCFSNKSD